MSNRTLQARLRDLRASGKSYAQLGRELGVDRSTVSRWASGKRTPSRNVREKVYRRWRKSEKSLRNPGAVVDLSNYFRRVWYDDGPIVPLAYRNVPPYSWPSNAPVIVTARFVMTVNDVGGLEELDGSLNVNVSSNGDIGTAVEEQFLEFIVKAQTSFKRILKVVREAVVLRWMK